MLSGGSTLREYPRTPAPGAGEARSGLSLQTTRGNS
jgi:hypothetical protein